MNFRRKRFWIAAFLLPLIGVLVAFRVANKNQFHAEMEEWRRAGLPRNGDELHAWYKAVPPEQNAALVVLEARDAWVAPAAKADPTQMDLPTPGKALSREMTAAIEDYITKNSETLAKLHEAAALPESRYPVNLWQGFSTLLPHLAEAKSLAVLLKHEAVYYSLKGQREKAVRSIRTSFALARTLRDEPILISQLVHIAIVAINLSSLERLICEHQLSASEIDLLSRDVETAELDGRRGLFRALVGERTNGSWAFGLSFSEFSALGGGGPPSPASSFFGGTMFMLYKASGLRNRDTRIYVETMRDFIAASTNEFPAAIQLSKSAEQRMDERLKTGLGRFAIMSRMILPALIKAQNKVAVNTAKLRSARMALEVEKHRLRRGSLPHEFSATGAEILRDPLDGSPVQYERQEIGYRLVSSGATQSARTKKNPVVGMVVTR